jgi:ribosomal protein S27AE
MGSGKNKENRPTLDARMSAVSQLSKLTSELALSDEEHDHDKEDVASHGGKSEVHCRQCGGADFKVRHVSGERVLACGRCGMIVEEDVGEEVKQEETNAYARFYT